MKKIISFSLYGNKPNFQVGAVVNVLEAKRLYPDWKCRFYTTDDEGICKQLEYLGAEIVRMDDHWMNQGYSYGSLWRFLAVDDADVCIFRDTDSVVNEREVGAVNEWLATDKQWHIMHDHNHHKASKIMAGMFGYRACERDTHDGRIFDFKNKDSMLELIQQWLNGSTNKSKSFDQNFLAKVIHPTIGKSFVSHGIYGQSFPEHTPCRYGNFVGDYSFWAGGWKGFVNGDKKSTSVPVAPLPETRYDRVLDRVIVSCDSHPNYLDFWPLVVSAWKKIDVKATLVLIEKPDENIEVDETIGDVIRIRLKDDSVHSAFTAQAVRLLVPCLYPDENITIADMDIIPLNKEYFFQNLCRGPEDSFIEYRHGCIGGGQTAICWNAAKGSVWGDIFGISATMEDYEDVFINRLKEWSPSNYKPISQGKSAEWFEDQRLLHQHLSRWSGKRVKLTDSDCGHRRLDHRMRHPPGMHDYYTDFCPRRPPRLNLAFLGRADLDNIDTIKHVFDWYKIPWIYDDVREEAYSNPEYCIVTFCNRSYLDETRRTVESLRNQGRWAGEIVVMVGDDLKEEEDLFTNENVVIKYFPDIDRTKAIEIYKTLPASIGDGREIKLPFQWHKIHCFQHFFKKWKKCLVIDGGMRIYNPIRKILDIDCEEQLLAHSDAYPDYNWRLSDQFDKKYFPELYEEISSKHDLDVDYFQTGLLMYNTSIINDNTFNEINSLQKKYLNSRTNEQAVLNLYFNLEKKMWKQLPFNKNSVPYYDAVCRTDNKADYIMTKW